jgi:DNA repair protein RecO (recombination protein O)
MSHPAAALVMDDPLALAMLTAACSVAEGAQLEQEPHPRVFDGLVRLLARLPAGEAMLADYIRWEATLLTDLGYGLDLTSCAVTGAETGLEFVSPRTGRAVSAAGAGQWKSRLLRLPPLLLGEDPGDPSGWRDGLRLTGHFLARDAFGLHHRPLPDARQALYERVADLVAQTGVETDSDA